MQRYQNILWKISHSHRYLKELDIALNEYLARGPIGMVGEIDQERRVVIYRAKFLEEVPVKLRLLAGEVVTHLRSALDHIAWQLALMVTSTPHPKTEFPIFRVFKEYTKEAPQKLQSISVAAREIIESLQPFHADKPGQHPLWLLYRLANDDKHKFITILIHMPTALGADNLGDGMRFIARHTPFGDGDEIARIDFSDYPHPFDESFHRQINPTITASLCLKMSSNNAILPVVPTLQALGEQVENILKQFERFFRDNPPVEEQRES